MKSAEFEERFDAGEDVSAAVDWSKARRVNVDFPAWVVSAPDRESKRLGVTRQALIRMRIADRLG